MTASSGLIAFLEDVLAPLGRVAVRRMFGGAGLYCDGAFFALIIEDSLYFRTDEADRSAYEAEGMEPFRYETKARQVTVGSYYRAPERLFDDPTEMQDWARRAVAASRKAVAAKSPKTSRRQLAEASPARPLPKKKPRRKPSA